MRQYLVLLEYLLTARTCDWHAEKFDGFMSNFFEEVIGESLAYYMWMEVVLEWLFKVTGSHQHIRDWFFENLEKWQILIQWVKQNRDPPSAYQTQYAQGGGIRMKLTKNRNHIGVSQMRTDKIKNTAVQHYRLERLDELQPANQ